MAGGRICYAGPAARAPDADRELAGPWFLMPGARDAHVHIGLDRADAVLRGGVTEAWDLGWPPDAILPLRRRSLAPEFAGPRLRAAGSILTATGGYPALASWAPAGTAFEVRGAGSAAAAVERLFALGVDLIKVALNADAGPVLADDELRAICRVASARGLRVAAHVQGAGQTARALEAGVGILAHCPWEPLASALVAAVAARADTISTLDIHRGADRERAVANLAAIHAAGGRILYGTDLGNGPIPAGIHAGEAACIASAGLRPREVLGAMVDAPLQPGAPGDLVALDGDPLADLAALGRVAITLRAGCVAG